MLVKGHICLPFVMCLFLPITPRLMLAWQWIFVVSVSHMKYTVHDIINAHKHDKPFYIHDIHDIW